MRTALAANSAPITALEKCSYRDGELRNRQLDEQELDQERDEKEDEYRTGRDELAM